MPKTLMFKKIQQEIMQWVIFYHRKNGTRDIKFTDIYV